MIQTCGEYKGLQEPGCSCICFPITTVKQVSLAVQQHVCKTDCKTQDSVTVRVMTAVQYQIRRDLVKAACFDIESPLSQIEAEVDSVLRTTLPGMTLDESYQAKEKMVELILASVQEAMKRYGYDIIKVLITDIKPEGSVLAAMNNIIAQRRRREAAVEKGEAEKFLKVKAAEAEAEAKRLAGVGMAGMRLATAHGLLNAMQFFKDTGMTNIEAMQMMITTQYLDTLKDFSRHTSVVVPHVHATGTGETQAQREASLSEAPQQMLDMQDEGALCQAPEPPWEMEDGERLPNSGTSGKTGKTVRKKKRKVKKGTALCDCGENQENQL